jgi:ankyrin repeat protein
MGKKKSKARGAPSPTASVAANSVSVADITEAYRVGDLGKLQKSKRQGVRVTTGGPLTAAAHGGFVALVRFLSQEFRVDVNQMRDAGSNPVLIAAQKGHLDVLRCLVNDLGADVNPNVNGITPLFMAAQESHLEVSAAWSRSLAQKSICPRTMEPRPCISLPKRATMCTDVVRCLVTDLGPDVNQARHDGYTPLHVATRDGKLDVLRCLVNDGGADVN